MSPPIKRTNFSPIFSSLFRFMGFGGTSQYSGEQLPSPTRPVQGPTHITEDVALSNSAMFGCARIITETVATMPLYTYVKKGSDWVEDETDDLYRLLQIMPNQHMTQIEFWESVLINLCLRGNGYASILRNEQGLPMGLYPLAAQQVQPFVMKDGSGWYLYNLDGEQMLIAAEDMLHFRIFGNGRVGLNPMVYANLALGTAAAADQYAGTFFSRGGKPGGVLTIDRILTPKQRTEVRESFGQIHEGADNAHKLFVLEAGMKYQQTQLDPESVQMIETRRYSVKDIARFWGVPAFLLNESEGSTSWGTGLEQQMLGFYNLTIRPYTLRIAAQLRHKLVPVGQMRRRKVAYDYDELVAVDLKAKAEYYAKMVANGIMSRAEVRGRLMLPRHPDPLADSLTVQSAMVPLHLMGKAPAKPNSGVSNDA